MMMIRQVDLQWLRDAGRCRRGASAAEFALIVPLLVAFLFGTFQYGIMMFTYNLMVDSARDTARAMAVCTIPDGDTATAITQAQSGLPKFLPLTNFTIVPTFGSPVTVSITVAGSQASILSILPSPPSLTATSIMVKEPKPYGGGSC